MCTRLTRGQYSWALVSDRHIELEQLLAEPTKHIQGTVTEEHVGNRRPLTDSLHLSGSVQLVVRIVILSSMLPLSWPKVQAIMHACPIATLCQRANSVQKQYLLHCTPRMQCTHHTVTKDNAGDLLHCVASTSSIHNGHKPA